MTLFFHKKVPSVNEEKEEVFYYSVVKSLSRLLNSQTIKHSHTKHFCPFCLQGFDKPVLLDKHEELCLGHNAVRTILPEKRKTTLQFKNIQNCLECPINIFANFESLLTPLEETSGEIKKISETCSHFFCYACCFSYSWV